MRRRWRRAVAVALFVISSLGLPSEAAALPYDGTNPGATPCGDGSHPVYVLAQATIKSGATTIGKVELRQSAYCATVWSRVYNQTALTLNLRETIMLYSSPNLSGLSSFPITDNGIPPGGSAWSKQYRDRPANRAMGEIFYSGAWRSATTVESLMWTQREGNYNDSGGPFQPYTCDGTVGNECRRWRTNSDGTPITLRWKDDSSLLELAGDPIGDIDFILGKFNDLVGPMPNLVKTTGTSYEVYNFRYSANDGNYALSICQVDAAGYCFYGYSKFNDTVTFNDGYRSVECHEFLHVLGFSHITTNGRTGSQASCMGKGYDTGPYTDDAYLLNQVYSTPI